MIGGPGATTIDNTLHEMSAGNREADTARQQRMTGEVTGA